MKASPAPVRVLIAGGSTLFRDGLKALVERVPDFACIDAVADAEALADGASLADVDVVLLDIDDASRAQIDRVRRLRRLDSRVRVLIVADDDVQPSAGSLVVAGASGVVTRDRPAEHLIDAIRKVHDGELWIDRATAARLIADFAAGREAGGGDPVRALVASLTRREREVTAFLATGLSNKAIAQKLGISDNTVRHHLTSIFGKVGVSDRLSLVLFAVRHKSALEDLE